MKKIGSALVILCALAFAAPAAAANWKQLAKSRVGALWIDEASVRGSNGEFVFDYRVDFPKAQKELETGKPYRSTVTRAIVRCTTKLVSTGPTTAYAGPGATGNVVGKYPPSPEEARFQPVDPGSSDENLWRHLCRVAEVNPRKSQ